jgi:hypothetical protein
MALHLNKIYVYIDRSGFISEAQVNNVACT